MAFKIDDVIPTDAPVTCMLMLLILIFSMIGIMRRDVFMKMVLHPFSISKQRQYYRMFTADLVSNDLMHLVLNEFVLSFFGGNLEEEMNRRSAHGGLYFLFIYGCSWLFGTVYTILRNNNDFDFSSAGSSGSVLGCAFSYMILQPNVIACYLPVIGGLKNKYEGIILIVMLIIYQRKTNNPMINHEMHFFGAIGGVLGTFVLFPNLL